jgi:hypothetical protein
LNQNSRRNPRESSDPVHARDVRQLVRDDRLGLVIASTARLFSRMTGRSPQLIRGELVAGEQRRTVLEAHAALGAR